MTVRDIVMSSAGASGAPANYIEDVFSTWLYTGTGATQTITNGIDLAGKGGLVWLKSRAGTTLAGYDKHILFDTVRGNTVSLSTSNTAANEAGWGDSYLRFLSNGFDTGIGSSNLQEYLNKTGVTYASWTFREQPKFYTQGTYTGTGSARTVAHDLGSEPGCIIVKKTNVGGTNWTVYHRSLGNTKALRLNTTEAETSSAVFWNNTSPTSTDFTVGTNSGVNESGESYVYYLFAHNAGGFGLSGTDNVISCGSYTGNGSTAGNPVTLGFEPQWLLIKQTNTSGNNWVLVDTMRGIPTGSDDALLYPNTSGAEAYNDRLSVTSTGFSLNSLGGDTNANGSTYIYIAIRRGPMRTPTTGTSVFAADKYAEVSNPPGIGPRTFGFAPDLLLHTRLSGGYGYYVTDKLRGGYKNLEFSSTSAEFMNTEYTFGSNGATPGFYFNNAPGDSSSFLGFRRAPGFFDVVCYTGTGSARTVAHNLGVAPEMMIVKSRGPTVRNWLVYSAELGPTKGTLLNTNGNPTVSTAFWNDTSPTSTVFSLGTNSTVNASGDTFVAYLFASCPGVSKVGSYTGTGTVQTINCGFTGGARFVMIRRTDSTGDWYVWDSARGIVAGNDPHLSLNSAAAEVTTNDSVDPVASGFAVNQVAATNINGSGASYIYLAIA